MGIRRAIVMECHKQLVNTGWKKETFYLIMIVSEKHKCQKMCMFPWQCYNCNAVHSKHLQE